MKNIMQATLTLMFMLVMSGCCSTDAYRTSSGDKALTMADSDRPKELAGD